VKTDQKMDDGEKLNTSFVPQRKALGPSNVRAQPALGLTD